MKYWKNTKTLDSLVPALEHVVALEDAEIAVIGSRPMDLKIMPRLRAIFKCGVGTDNIPFEAAKERGVVVGMPSEQTRRYIIEETANYAVYLILQSLFKDAGDVDNWRKRSRTFLGDRMVLVLGLGNIGLHVKRKLECLLKVCTFDLATDAIGALKPLLERADVVTLHIPLNDSTEGFIDREKLSWMRDGAVLVNTARGFIVEEQALFQEVRSGRLSASFDVFWQEPYDGILRQFHPDGFRISPHVASNCDDFLSGLAQDLIAFTKEIEQKK